MGDMGETRAVHDRIVADPCRGRRLLPLTTDPGRRKPPWGLSVETTTKHVKTAAESVRRDYPGSPQARALVRLGSARRRASTPPVTSRHERMNVSHLAHSRKCDRGLLGLMTPHRRVEGPWRTRGGALTESVGSYLLRHTTTSAGPSEKGTRFSLTDVSANNQIRSRLTPSSAKPDGGGWGLPGVNVSHHPDQSPISPKGRFSCPQQRAGAAHA